MTAGDVAEAVRSAIKVGQLIEDSWSGITAIIDGAELVIGGSEDTTFTTDASAAFVRRVLAGSQTIRVVTAPTIDGQFLTISDGSGNTVGFQIVNSAIANPIPLGADRFR